MSVQTNTGTVLSVSVGEPATFNLAGFLAKTFTDIGEVTDIPEYGPNAQVIEHNALKGNITKKYKGFIDYGSTAIQLARDTSDAGQNILDAATDGATRNSEHSFKVGYQDGSADFFIGKVFSCTSNPSSANSIIGRSAGIEINSPIIRFIEG